MSAQPKIDVQQPARLQPRLSVRSVAKFVQMPALEQMRLLHDQKFPKQAPQVFRSPYYSVPLKGIRDFLEGGSASLPATRNKLQGIGVPSRRMHCTRVLESFLQSEHAQRGLKPQPISRYALEVNGLDIRLSPDLVALAGTELRYIYFNANAHEQHPETARLHLEYAYWLLKELGMNIQPRQVELIDLFTGKLYFGRKPRKTSIRDLLENSRLIATLWTTIDP